MVNFTFNIETVALILEILLSLAAISGILFAARTRLIQSRVKYTVKRIASANRMKNIPTNVIELKHTIRWYVKQIFRVDSYIGANAQKRFLSTSAVIKDIKKSLDSFEYNLYCISGGPALGKSVALRYIFSRLAKTTPCFYFPMRSFNNLEEIKIEIKVHKQIHDSFSKAARIPTPIAFFDGIDEAYSLIYDLRMESREKGREERPLFDLFLSNKPLICNLFAECGLNQPIIVISVRPEILDDGIEAFRKSETGNSRVTVCELQKMGYHIRKNKKTGTVLINDPKQRDIMKLYCSLRLLQKAEVKVERNRIKQKPLRYGDKFPPKENRKKCLGFLKDCLAVSEDSLFRYPMFVRYAYILYKNMMEENGLSEIKEFSYGNDFYASFYVLIDSIVKWEFSKYTIEDVKDGKSRDTKLYSQFKEALFECLKAIAANLFENRSTDEQERFKAREVIKSILDKYLPKSEVANENIYIAHSLMVCDEGGRNFDFVHHSFYEYFTAMYLYSCDCNHESDILCNGYSKRKKLPRDEKSSLLRHYFSFLCNDTGLAQKIACSLNLGERLIPSHLSDIASKDYLLIIDEPTVTIWKIYQYIPFVNSFKYRDIIIKAEEINQIIIGKGKLDLSNSRWDFLRFIMDIAPCDRFTELKLRGLSLGDFELIAKFVSLKMLDLINSKVDLNNYWASLESLSLEWLAVCTDCDSLINALYEKNTEMNFAQKIWVWTDAYSPVFIKIYEKNEAAKKQGNKALFEIWRTPLEKAEKRFSNIKAADIPLMKAIFELEADEDGNLGLSKKEPMATLWNGLTLARCYEDLDYDDVKKNARKIYERLETNLNHLDKNNKLSVYYGYHNAGNLMQYINYDSNTAKLWIKQIYQYAEAQVSKRFSFDCGSRLLEAYIRCADNDSQKHANDLIPNLILLADDLNINKTSSDYMTLLKYQVGYSIKFSKHSFTEMLHSARSHFIAAKEYADKNKTDNNKNNNYHVFNAYYYISIVLIIAQKYQAALNAVDRMGGIIKEQTYKCGNTSFYGMEIRYFEQRMFLLFMLGRFIEAKSLAEEYLNYPHRISLLAANAAKYIIFKCDSNDEEISAHPEYENQFNYFATGFRTWL